MFSDDPKADPDGVLADYHRWLYKVAISMSYNLSDVDDLVQEGRIAMWRALQTFDGEQGSLPSWLTRAAQMRMRDIARGRPATGHEALRAHAEAVVAVSLDSFEEENEAERIFHLIDTFDYVETAYHKGLIAKAMETLSPKQREYVFLRFFAGIEVTSALPSTVAAKKQYPVLSQRYLWHGTNHQPGARERLGEALRELQGAS